MSELFDLDRLDDTDPFEIDRQAAHLFKHDPYGIDDIYRSGARTRCSTQPNHQPAG